MIQNYSNVIDIILCYRFIQLAKLKMLHTRVRVRMTKEQKERPAQPEWPWQDGKILRRCMSRSPYKPQVPSEDRVAVLWKAPVAHKPGSMKGLVPSR